MDSASNLNDPQRSITPSPLKGSPNKEFNSFSYIESPSLRRTTDLSSNSSPRKGTSTRVIETLHIEIDDLKSEIAKLKSNNDELKKSNEFIKKRRDQLVEQLSNSKHENDTINSLLQRKQRRINDLEEQLGEYSASSDDYKFKLHTLQSRYDTLYANESVAISENERLKSAYETIVSSHQEYKKFYTDEIKQLKDKLHSFTETKKDEITRNISLINKSDATIYRSIKSVTLRLGEIEQLNAKRDEVSRTALEEMSSSVKKHDTGIQELLKLSKDLFDEISEKYGIDKISLLKAYLEENPDAELSLISSEGTKSTHEVADDSKPLNSEVKKIQNQQITVKKRRERSESLAKDNERVPSVEDRIKSLGKDLNSRILAKDRVPSNKSTRSFSKPRHELKSSSRRSSKLFESNTRTEDSGIEDFSISSDIISKGLITSEVSITNETIDENTPPVKAKKKRQRRRRRKRNQSALNKDSQLEDNESGNESGNESS